MKQNVKDTIGWIVGELNGLKIPYVIIGGLAAHYYGSKREIIDIDIGIPNEHLRTLEKKYSENVVEALGRGSDEHWDLELMVLKYDGVLIDVFGLEEVKIFNQGSKEWERLDIDLGLVKVGEIGGIMVNIIDIESLINYKRKLNRKVDIQDVGEIL